MVAPVCRQKSHAVISWKSYMTQSPAMAALTTLRCSHPPFSRGFHPSASLHKRRRNEQEDEFNQMLENHRQELKKTPRSAVYLSLAGLAPVAVAPLIMSIGGYYYPEMAYLQIATASCLLSFYGGIRWGISVPENSPWGLDSLNFLLGALLPFVAWTALLTSDNILVSAFTVIGGLVLGVFGGVGMLHPFPFWLSFLRAVTFLVTFCSIAITLYLSVVYPEKSLKNQSPK